MAQLRVEGREKQKSFCCPRYRLLGRLGSGLLLAASLLLLLLGLMQSRTSAQGVGVLAAPRTDVRVVVSPTSVRLGIGEMITAEVIVEPNGQPLDGIEAQLLFSPIHLAVAEPSGRPTNTVEPGTTMETLYNAVDNAAGVAIYSGYLFYGVTEPTRTFTLARIPLVAQALTTEVFLALGDETMAAYSGDPVTPTTLSGTVVICQEGNEAQCTCRLLGDFDCDGDVDIVDVQRVASRWNLVFDDPRYELRFDVDNDADIDTLDIVQTAQHWSGGA